MVRALPQQYVSEPQLISLVSFNVVVTLTPILKKYPGVIIFSTSKNIGEFLEGAILNEDIKPPEGFIWQPKFEVGP